jgi:hypothetical protein
MRSPPRLPSRSSAEAQAFRDSRVFSLDSAPLAGFFAALAGAFTASLFSATGSRVDIPAVVDSMFHDGSQAHILGALRGRLPDGLVCDALARTVRWVDRRLLPALAIGDVLGEMSPDAVLGIVSSYVSVFGWTGPGPLAAALGVPTVDPLFDAIEGCRGMPIARRAVEFFAALEPGCDQYDSAILARLLPPLISWPAAITPGVFIAIVPLAKFVGGEEFLRYCAGQVMESWESADQSIVPLIRLVCRIAGKESVGKFLDALDIEGNDQRLIESVIELKALDPSAFREAARWVLKKADLGLAGARLVLEARETGRACPDAVDCLAALIGDGCCDKPVIDLFRRFVAAFPETVQACKRLGEVFTALALSHDRVQMECAAKVAGWVAPPAQQDVLKAFYGLEFPGGTAEVKVALDIMAAIYISGSNPLSANLKRNQRLAERGRQISWPQKWRPPSVLDMPCFSGGGLEPVYCYFRRMIDDGLVDHTNISSFVRASCRALGQWSFPLWLPHVNELTHWETAKYVLSLVPNPEATAGYLDLLSHLLARFSQHEKCIRQAALRLGKARGHLLDPAQMADLMKFVQPLVLTTDHLNDLFDLALEYCDSLVPFAVASVDRLKLLIVTGRLTRNNDHWRAIARFHSACRARIDPAYTAFPATEDERVHRVAEAYNALVNAQDDEEMALLGELMAALHNMYDRSQHGDSRSQREELAKHWHLPEPK